MTPRSSGIAVLGAVVPINCKRQTNSGLTTPPDLRRLDPGRPSAGCEFSDAIDRKIGQAREHRAEVVAERQAAAATSFDDRNDGDDSWSGLFTAGDNLVAKTSLGCAAPQEGRIRLEARIPADQYKRPRGRPLTPVPVRNLTRSDLVSFGIAASSVALSLCARDNFLERFC
jgi:hypothetical protein